MKHSPIVSAAFLENIKKAAEVLKRGGVVAFPTETVYGLGANAFNAESVARIFEIKKRPHFDPLIVHVHSRDQVRLLWPEIPSTAVRLMDAFWPGPLTIVYTKKENVPGIVTGDLPTVGVRMPGDNIALKLIELADCPIAAPSANLFGHTSPTTAIAVDEDLGGDVDMILDGGSTLVGVESTVVKIEKEGVRLLRPGGVPLEEIAAIVKVSTDLSGGHESPGLLQTHYAPRTAFILADEGIGSAIEAIQELRPVCQKLNKRMPSIGWLFFGDREMADRDPVEVLSPQKDLRQAAARLFQAIRKLDKMHLDLIVAEPVPTQGLGLAIQDRLLKAAGGKTNVKEFLEQWGKI
jgi:L-threonylcarbamoyladenylate synthase